MVRVAERWGEMLAGMISAALAEAAPPDDVARRMRGGSRQVRELAVSDHPSAPEA
jgi:hypothetical protein